MDISETTAQTYTGSEITPTPTIKFGDVTLVKDKDYIVSNQDNVNAGKENQIDVLMLVTPVLQFHHHNYPNLTISKRTNYTNTND